MPATIVHLLHIHVEVNTLIKNHAAGIVDRFDTVLILLLPSPENRSQFLVQSNGMILQRIARYDARVGTALQCRVYEKFIVFGSANNWIPFHKYVFDATLNTYELSVRNRSACCLM